MGIVKSTGFRHCQVNWLPRDQATLSSIQVWFYYRYLGAASPPGDCSLSARSHQETERSLSDKVWRIGDSAPAPRFNIVSKPNDWSRQVTRSINETQKMQVAYWTAFNVVLNKAGGRVSGDKTPQRQSWISWGVGCLGFGLLAGTNTRESQIRAQLSLSGPNAKGFFGLLEQQKDEIEQELRTSGMAPASRTERIEDLLC